MRTAAAGAVSVRHMAREDAASVTVAGTGVQDTAIANLALERSGGVEREIES